MTPSRSRAKASTIRWCPPVLVCASPRTAVRLLIWAADQPSTESERADLTVRPFCFCAVLFLIPLRSGLRACGAWRSVGLAANLTLDYHAACGGARLGHLPF